MNETMYKIYSKIASLACGNVKTEICHLNMFKGNEVTVQVRGKDNVVNLADQITKHPVNAVTSYSKDADRLLVIRSTEPTIKMLTAGRVFVESVISSRNSRVAQKRLVEYGAVERFLGEAYVYDSKHRTGSKVESAMTKAKDIVSKKCSLAVLGSFDFDSGRPVLDPTIRKDLEDSAFNPKFAFLKRESLLGMVDKRYSADFADKVASFATMRPVSPVSASQVEKAVAVKKAPPVQTRETPVNSNTLMFDKLWDKKFVDLPLSGVRRKFVNLRARFNNLFVAPKPALIMFRQKNTVEVMTKRKFIVDYYLDLKPADYEERDIARYLFQQENAMYKYMWGSKQGVKYQNGRLFFPDNTNIAVPKDETPHEFFHKVNAVYAALFGFTKDDEKPGDEWLFNTVRKAYTEEGMAEYSLAVISHRLAEAA